MDDQQVLCGDLRHLTHDDMLLCGASSCPTGYGAHVVRICLGKHFALAELVLVLASVARRHRLVLPDGAPEVRPDLPSQCNPDVAQARQHLLDWVRQTGLIRRESARRRFDRADFGWFASLVYPTADRGRLELLADWFAWLFLVDDELDDGRIGRAAAALAVLDDLLAVLCEGDADRVAPNAAESVAVTALADLWRRTSAETGPTWQQEQLRVHNGRYWNATIPT